MNWLRIAFRHLVTVEVKTAGAVSPNEPVSFDVVIGGLPVLRRDVSHLEWIMIENATVFGGLRRIVCEIRERRDGSVSSAFGVACRIADLPAHTDPDQLQPWSVRPLDEPGTCILVLAELLRTPRARVAPDDLAAEGYHILAGLLSAGPATPEAIAIEALLAGLD